MSVTTEYQLPSRQPPAVEQPRALWSWLLAWWRWAGDWRRAIEARLSAQTVLDVDDEELADGNMSDSQVNIWLDEASDELNIKVKYSDGTVRSGVVALS